MIYRRNGLGESLSLPVIDASDLLMAGALFTGTMIAMAIVLRATTGRWLK